MRRREVIQGQIEQMSTAYGIISMERDRVRHAGALKAARAINRALKSLDGAIRHAQISLAIQEKGQ